MGRMGWILSAVALGAVLWVLLVVLGGLGGAAAPGQRIAVGDRAYWLSLPPGASSGPLPLLVALHGGGGKPGQFARNSGIAGAALARGFAVALPAGSGRLGRLSWNAGQCCGHAAAAGVDDLGFLDAVIADARSRLGTDAGPVFIAGMSNGSMMAQAYAAARPGALAGVAAVSGTPDLARFAPSAPVPLLILHGTADQNVPFEGGLGRRSRAKTAFHSVRATLDANLALWRPLGVAGPLHRTLPGKGRLRATEDLWTHAGHPALALVTIEGGAHAWPGGRAEARRNGASGIEANRLILDFFTARLAAGG